MRAVSIYQEIQASNIALKHACSNEDRSRKRQKQETPDISAVEKLRNGNCSGSSLFSRTLFDYIPTAVITENTNPEGIAAGVTLVQKSPPLDPLESFVRQCFVNDPDTQRVTRSIYSFFNHKILICRFYMILLIEIYKRLVLIKLEYV
jgi:hypothetical protein